MPSLPILAALIAVVFLAIRYAYSSWRNSQSLNHIPTQTFPDGDNSHSRYLHDLKSLLEIGYNNYNRHGRAFKVPIHVGGYPVKYRVILPRDHLEEIKHLTNNAFSWHIASRIVFAQDYTGAPDRGAWTGKALRIGIHQNLKDITSQLDARISDHYDSQLPLVPGATGNINLMQFFVPAIAYVSNWSLVDERLASDPEWVKQTAEFAVNRHVAAEHVRAYPPYIAKLIAPLLPSVRKLRRSKQYVRDMMKPLYEELKTRGDLRIDDKQLRVRGSLGYEWLWGGAPVDVTLEQFADTMMRVLIAAIHTTAKTISVALIDLLSRSEMLRELQEEAMAVAGRDGRNIDPDKLIKLDCFLKESQRLSPVFLLTMNRVVMHDYAFKCSNLFLPKGTLTSAAASSVATDPDSFTDPSSFDGHRYQRLRENRKEAESSLLMGMSRIDSLGFGLGNQACPGRFLAANNVKLMMAKLLVGWELVLEKDGEDSRGQPPETRWSDMMIVSPSEFSVRLRRL